MNLRKTVPFWAAGVFLCAASALAQGFPAFFPPRVANTSIAGTQANGCVAIDDPALGPNVSANSIVVWEEIRSAGVPGFYQLDLEANQLDPNGANVAAGEFDAVASANSQYETDVAGDGKGKYVVVWTSETGGVNSDVFGRIFDGTTPGNAFQVNTNTTGYQSHPSVARNANGDFVVVWESQSQIGGDVTIQAQRFLSTGAMSGSEFQVNTTAGNPGSFAFNERADVAIRDNGDVLVVWKSPQGSGPTVVGRLFPSSGTPTGETLIDPASAGVQDDPHVAVNATGDYLVVWQQPHLGVIGVSGKRVVFQTGTPPTLLLGAPFSINTVTAAARSDVAAAGDQFVAVWFYGGARGQIFGRRIESNFRIVTREFQVTNFGPDGCQHPTLNCPDHPRVAANSLGNVIVTWNETDDVPPTLPASFTGGVWARRLELNAARLITINPPPAGPISVRAPQAVDNGVIEPGETVAVAPAWKNTLEGTLTLTGTGSDLKGPAGGTYTLDDTTADYGSIDEGESADCKTATGNCYQATISGTPRPATHWDATFLETLSNNLSHTWSLHVGESFTDVPTSQTFYRAIESVLHSGITTGCTTTTYCPGDPVTRSQMSLFLARGVAGGGPAIPTSGQVGGNAYNCVSGGTSLFTDVLPTDSFCRSVHYVAAQNVTAGCEPTKYCPTPNVKRLEMAAFVARAVVAPGGGAAVPLTYEDPVTKLSYSCDAASPDVHFTDVPASLGFCKHAHFLWAKGIISGCGNGTTFCPDDPVTRGAMARFLSNGFQVQLYGP